MATTAITKGLTREEVGLQTTIMAIREEIMSYFKGGCVQRLTNSDNINLRQLDTSPSNRRSYNYERRRAELQQPVMLELAGIPIITMQKNPDVITFHKTVLERSPQFRRIYKEVDEAIGKYLRAVRKEHNDANVLYN
jgi:hypothetical protein